MARQSAAKTRIFGHRYHRLIGCWKWFHPPRFFVTRLVMFGRLGCKLLPQQDVSCQTPGTPRYVCWSVPQNASETLNFLGCHSDSPKALGPPCFSVFSWEAPIYNPKVPKASKKCGFFCSRSAHIESEQYFHLDYAAKFCVLLLYLLMVLQLYWFGLILKVGDVAGWGDPCLFLTVWSCEQKSETDE